MATTPVSAPTTPPVTVEKYQIQAVHGLVIHPYTLTNFKVNKPVAHEQDEWTLAQINAGLLKLV